MSDSTPVMKNTIRSAFEAKRDTLDTWALLQANCLLLKAEKERQQTAGSESLLSRRIRLVRESKTLAEDTQKPAEVQDKPRTENKKPKPATPTKPAPRPVRPSISNRNLSSHFPKSEERPLEIRDPGQRTKTDYLIAQAQAKQHWLTVTSSGRNIALPTSGEITFGRFDPNFGIPPDIDLGYEDSADKVISRRHARLIARDGAHYIAEMGSKAGVRVNGQKLMLGEEVQLQTGSTVTIGKCLLMYELVPPWVEKLNPGQPIEHRFMVAATGQRILIPVVAEQIVGRSDRYVNFTPNIDLADLGNFAKKVSRRHASLVFKPGEHKLYIQDMGSGFGTKVNGQLIMLGEMRALSPGDHVWLAGCVLAYDIRLR